LDDVFWPFAWVDTFYEIQGYDCDYFLEVTDYDTCVSKAAWLYESMSLGKEKAFKPN